MEFPEPLPPLNPQNPWTPARRPTMYFIGVTTHQSSIMRIFPRWAAVLGLGDAELRGINFPLHDRPEHYRHVVQSIKDDPLACGALVTTHKLDVLAASRDLFEELDEFAALMQEVSSIAKRGSRLVGHAKDAVNSGLAVDSIVGAGYWERTRAAAFVCGAGGASVALTWYLLHPGHGANRPSRLLITDRDDQRLAAIQRVHQQAFAAASAELPDVEYHRVADAQDTDRLLASCPARTLVVNATGLGKDAPGSPLSDAALFPHESIAWDFNYRGDLVFLAQASRQQHARSLRVVDGWEYFLHGWTSVIAEVFERPIPTSGPLFEELAQIAAEWR